MKKDTSHTIRRAEHFKTILTGEGFLVGLIAGLVVLLYRVLLEFCRKMDGSDPSIWKRKSGYIRGLVSPPGCYGLYCRKAGEMGTYDLRQRDPPGRGRNDGKLNQRWWRILPAKFLGGFLSLLAGLSSGKRGSVHPDRSYDRKGSVKSIGQREDRGKISAHLRSKRRSGSGISCPSCGSHVFLLKRFIRIFLYLY